MQHPLELLERAAVAFVRSGYVEDGPPAGRNGPHKDPESPLRNTAHWLILFCRLYELTANDQHKRSAEQLAVKLLGDKAIAAGRIPVLRHTTNKDSANGVIGAAWLIEGLVMAGHTLGWPELFDAASKLADYFPFDDQRNLWKTREPNGSVLGIDTTLNHQLWFAKSCAMLPAASKRVAQNLTNFLKDLDIHLKVNARGLLAHAVHSRPLTKERLIRWSEPFFVEPQLMVLTKRLPKHRFIDRLRYISRLHAEKEVGYLIFTLHALATLDAAGCDLRPVRPMIDRAYSTLFDPAFQAEFTKSKWSYGYNPPGFEFPVVARQFGVPTHLSSLGASLYEIQMSTTYDPETATFSRNTDDPETLTARLYSLSLATIGELDLLATGKQSGGQA